MKQVLLGIALFTSLYSVLAQNPNQDASFYLGASFGAALAVGNFGDSDLSNPDAGFARNGRKIEVFGGYFLNRKERITLMGTFRYQQFNTELDDLIETLSDNNPGVTFAASSEEWETYSLLLGIAYKIGLTKKYGVFPRVALGPMAVTTPGISVISSDPSQAQNYSRTSETGVGIGYEFGLGLKKDIGRRLALVPSFTFSGGFVNIKDVVITTEGVSVTEDFRPKLFSFNLGISVAYKFY